MIIIDYYMELLPNELIIIICGFCNMKDIGRLQETSSHFKKSINLYGLFYDMTLLHQKKFNRIKPILYNEHKNDNPLDLQLLNNNLFELAQNEMIIYLYEQNHLFVNFIGMITSDIKYNFNVYEFSKLHSSFFFCYGDNNYNEYYTLQNKNQCTEFIGIKFINENLPNSKIIHDEIANMVMK